MDFGFLEVPTITVLCYFAGMVVKASPLNSKWIPTLCGLLGGVLGIVGHFVLPELMSKDIMSVIAIGVASGLAATGAHELGAQLTGKKTSENKSAQDSESLSS